VTPRQVLHYLPDGHRAQTRDTRAADTLALPPDETVLYLIPVGHHP